MKTSLFQLRLAPDEKEAFQNAAQLAGLPLSAWVRERLRKAAKTELREQGLQVPFVQSMMSGTK